MINEHNSVQFLRSNAGSFPVVDNPCYDMMDYINVRPKADV